MNEQRNEEKKVVFNTPQGLDLELLFSDLSIKFKPKAEFIIHQANHFHGDGGYQMHSKNHQWFFGIKGTELALIVRRLRDAGIITLAKNYNPGNTSNTYKMVQPFDIATSHKSYYHPNEILFVKKWVIDGYIVKNAATSAFKNVRKSPAEIIASLQKEIADLKAVIFEGRDEPDVLSTNIIAENDYKVLPVPEVITPTNSTPIEEDLLSDIINEKTISLIITETTPADDCVTPLHLKTDISVSKISDSEGLAKPGACLNVTESINHSLGGEMFLNGNLSIQPYEDMLCILYEDKVGCIENFENIKIWCLQLSKGEKELLYHSLITSTGNTVNFSLNKHTKAKFKRKEIDKGIIFTFDDLTKAA